MIDFYEIIINHLKRNGEVNGVHYHFVSHEEFESDLSSGKQKYLEHAIVHANMYGTRLDSVETVHLSGEYNFVLLYIFILLEWN